jgi:hypothetical protein
MLNSSLVMEENIGFASLVLPSLALQGAFERISRIPVSACWEISDWNDGTGGHEDYTDFTDAGD